MIFSVLDVSKYNAIVNYSSAAISVDGVIIRAGYRGYGATGTLSTDELFETHYRGFVNKIPVGVYWFSQAVSEEEAISEANYLYNLIYDKNIAFPIYIQSDYSNSSHNGRADSLVAADRTKITIAFCERIKKLGYRAGIMASDSWFKDNLVLPIISQYEDYSLWVERISTSEPVNVSNYDGWRYNAKGSILGYPGSVYLSYFYNDIAGFDDKGTRTDINELKDKIVMPYESTIYSGISFKPAITIPGLKLGLDYTLSYGENLSAGKGTITVTGVNNYKGTVELFFDILAKDISNMQLHLPADDYVYNGEEIKPNCYISKLKIEDDYILSYENNIEAGIATCIATGVGNYTGKTTLDFTIDPKPISEMEAGLYQETYLYNGEEIIPSYWVDPNLVEGTDYKVEFKDNIEISKEAKCIIIGLGNYGGENILLFEISAMTLEGRDIIIDKYDFTYDGTEKKPTGSIVDLVENVDYKISYKDNINAGERCKIIATGIGNYSGTIEADFTIKPQSIINKPLIMESREYLYIGIEITPKVLVENLDPENYIVKYRNNIDLGTATAVVTGIGNYKDSTAINFEIIQRPMSAVTANYGIPITESVIRYDNHTLELSVGDYILQEYVDYIIDSEEREDTGEVIIVHLIVSGIDGYRDTVSYKFRVIDYIPSIDYDDDGVLNFGDIDLDDETAEGDYDFGDLDEGVDPESVVKDEEDFDCEALCGCFLDGYGDDDGNGGNIQYDDGDDDGIYNFGDIDLDDETAEGDYDFGDLDEGVDEDTMARGDYDFNELSGTKEEMYPEGKEFELDNTPIYANYCSTTSSGKRSGTYYVYRTEILNNKVRLTRKMEAVNKPTRSGGWFDITDLENLGKLSVGDPVLVTGEIYKYADGSAGYIEKHDDLMYIVAILNDPSFDFPYALATGPNMTRQGWASKNSLTKYER